MRRFKLFLIIIVAFQLITNCKSLNNTQKGAIIGSVGGGAVGALIGKKAGNTAVGAIIGAAVGGTAGALIGRYMDKQAKELREDLKGARVERVGEGIKITFDSGILFQTGSSTLSSTAKNNINELANTLNKYKDTEILIEGHTDNVGKPDYNQNLSEERAESVSRYLTGKNVSGERITTKGYGENQPIVENSSKANQAKNRRVEIAIFANEKLKKAAKNGKLDNL